MHPDHQPAPVSPAQEQINHPRRGINRIIPGLSFILNWVIIPALIYFVLHNFVFQPFHVVGHSMVPTLNESDYLIISKVSKTWDGLNRRVYIPKRGQVVVFHYPKDPSLVFVKRVVGVPGDRVVVKDGSVRVYTKERPEGYNFDDGSFKTSAPITAGSYDGVIPAHNVFVIGDNRAPNGSFDSREWGPLPTSYIVGTARLRLLPFTQIRTFSVLPDIKL